jgi:hypothetical protein
VSLTPRLVYPCGKSPQYLLDRRLGGPQCLSGRCGLKKNLSPLPGIELRPSIPSLTELSRLLLPCTFPILFYYLLKFVQGPRIGYTQGRSPCPCHCIQLVQRQHQNYITQGGSCLSGFHEASEETDSVGRDPKKLSLSLSHTGAFKPPGDMMNAKKNISKSVTIWN